VTSDVFTAPQNPGSTPSAADLGAASLAKEITNLYTKHDIELKMYEEFMATDHLGVKLICAAVGDMYTSPLKDEYTGYAAVTTKQLLKHLTDEYCDIDETALVQNQARMSASYDPNLPIESWWEQIADCVAFTDAGSSAFTDK